MVFGFLDKSIDLSVELDQSNPVYRPGDVVRATIGVSSSKDVKVRGISAGLWLEFEYEYTDEYRDSDGDLRERSTWKKEHTWVGEMSLMAEGIISRGHKQVFKCAHQIPSDAVPTYSGKIIRNKWLMKVEVDRAMAADATKEIELQVLTLPSPKRVARQDMTRGDNLARLEIITSKSAYTDGEIIEGSLVVTPNQDLEVREVRLELVRIEKVLAGDRPREHEHIEHKVQLAPTTALSKLQIAAFNFSIPVAVWPHPSIETAQARVTWGLRGTLDRRMATDAEVWQELFCYYAEAEAAEQSS